MVMCVCMLVYVGTDVPYITCVYLYIMACVCIYVTQSMYGYQRTSESTLAFDLVEAGLSCFLCCAVYLRLAGWKASSRFSFSTLSLAVGMMALQMCTTFGFSHGFWELNLGCQAVDVDACMC